MSDRGRAVFARATAIMLLLGVAFGTGLAQGSRKESEAKKVVRDADPSLFPIVTPGASLTYRVSLKKGYTFDPDHGDGIAVNVSRGNVIVGDSRRVSSRIFELDLSSADNGVGGSVTLRINVTNSKGRLKFVRSAVTFALPGGNELVQVSADDKSILTRMPVGSRPIGVESGGLNQQQFTNAFVCNNGSNNVSVIDVFAQVLRATVPVGAQPTAVVIAGLFAFQSAYVTNSGSDSVSVIDAQVFGVTTTIAVGNNPQGIAKGGIAGLTERLYVANHDDDTVSVIDAQTNTVIDTVAVGNGPMGVAVNGPQGSQIVAVTNELDNTVTMIDANDDSILKTIPVGTRPVAVTSAGSALNIFYVANQGGNSVSVLETRTLTEATRVSVGVQPVALTVALASNIEELYVADSGDGTVSVVDTIRLKTVLTIPIGGRPRGLASSGPIGVTRVLVTN